MAMQYSYAYTMDSEEGIIAAILFSVLSSLFTGGIGVLMYAFRSIGVYSVAKRRGLNNPWFAWVPVVNSYLLGSLSDQYQYVVKGKVKSKRKWLLGLSIVKIVLYVAMIVMAVITASNVINTAMIGFGQAKLMKMAMSYAGRLLTVVIPFVVLAVVVKVIRYVALYDVYTSLDPKNSVLYTILSIAFRVAEPFFLFFNRKRDDGMPPRREAPKEEPVWEATKEEPWVNE